MKRIIVLACCMILVATVAHSAVTTYTGRDAATTTLGAGSTGARGLFDAAVGTSSVIDFENMALGYYSPLALAPGVSAAFGGSIYTSLSGVRNTTDVVLGFNTTAGGSKYLSFSPLFDPPTTPTLTFTYASPINAWGAYFTGFEPGIDGVVHVVFNDGTSQDFTIPDGDAGGGVGFWGFKSTGLAVSTITLKELGVSSSSRDIFGIDDVVYARVPEPMTMLLLGLGLVGLAGMRRFK